MVQKNDDSVLITGATGYIGSIATDFLKRGACVQEVHAYGSVEMDVTNRNTVQQQLDAVKPDCVLHLAARADTDWCEEHYDEAWRVNVDGSLNLVEEALDRSIPVVYFSSACLYPRNDKYYSETNDLDAFCRYTQTKLEAEQALDPHKDRILNIRMRQPFSNHRHPRNLLHKLASYSQFIDEPNSMSHLEECLPVVWKLLQAGKTGTWNITNEGWTTPLKIARLIKKYWQPDMSVSEMSYEALLEKVEAVRVNSLVDCSKLKAEGFELAPVEDAIIDCLQNSCNLGEYDWRGFT